MPGTDLERIAVLESLLGRAWKSLRRPHDDNQRMEVIDAIAVTLPHPDPTRHGHAGRGETRCEISLMGDVFPPPLLASKEIPVDCIGCLDAFIKEQNERIDQNIASVNEAQLLRAAAVAKRKES